jgi:hypothetical protein
MTIGSTRPSVSGSIGAAWGIVGLSLLFLNALMRLYPHACEITTLSLNWVHWLGLAVSLLFMGYAEGYKGFQLRFSPRAAARALYLRNHPTPGRIIFAPLFCMGFFHATRKRKIVAYSLTGMIVLLIVLVRQLPQPWRGIVDAGVVLGLGWGVLSVWFFSIKAFWGTAYCVSPETPDA